MVAAVNATGVRIGHGDGSARYFPLPCAGAEYLAVLVDNVALPPSAYDFLPVVTEWGTDAVVFREAPAMGADLTVDYAGAVVFVSLQPGLDITSIPLGSRVELDCVPRPEE